MTTETRCPSCGGAVGPHGHYCMGGRDITPDVRAIRWNCAKCGQSGEGLGADHTCPVAGDTDAVDARVYVPPVIGCQPFVDVDDPEFLAFVRKALAPPCHICGLRPGTKPITVETPAGMASAMICNSCELDLVRGGPWLPCRAN